MSRIEKFFDMYEKEKYAPIRLRLSKLRRIAAEVLENAQDTTALNETFRINKRSDLRVGAFIPLHQLHTISNFDDANQQRSLREFGSRLIMHIPPVDGEYPASRTSPITKNDLRRLHFNGPSSEDRKFHDHRHTLAFQRSLFVVAPFMVETVLHMSTAPDPFDDFEPELALAHTLMSKLVGASDPGIFERHGQPKGFVDPDYLSNFPRLP